MTDDWISHLRYWAAKGGVSLPSDDETLAKGLLALNQFANENSDKSEVRCGLMMLSRLRHNHLDGLTIDLARTIDSELRGSVR